MDTQTTQPHQRFEPLTVWAAITVAGLIIGSFGPWVTTFIANASGLNGDGKITLALGLAQLVALVIGGIRGPLGTQRALAAFAVGAAAAVVAIYDWAHIAKASTVHNEGGFLDGIQIAQPGWGVQMVAVAGCGLALCAATVLWHARQQRVHESLPTADIA